MKIYSSYTPNVISLKLFAILLLICCISTGVNAQTQNKTYLNYIDKFKDEAIRQQKKYKIPASITLAQGLLESGAGNGKLAKLSNNHFGIKCHGVWQGEKVYHDDDEQGECFRKYDDPFQSYEDHSLFLLKPRYADLFSLCPTDYKGWARGLKKAGYAEDPAYPQKLINLIERYELYKYDNYSRKDVSPILSNNINSGFSGSRPIYISNGLYYIIGNTGDTFKSLAKEFDVSRRKLIKYNDLYKNYNIKAGDIIYLEKKRNKGTKEHRFHTTAQGESLYSISQKYGIRLKSIFKMNPEYESYTTLKVGDVVILRK
jgi:LysM repeat protein